MLVLVNDFGIGSTVDPDLQIKGGRGYPEPELTRGWGAVSKMAGGGEGRAPPGSSTEDDSPGTLPIGQVI